MKLHGGDINVHSEGEGQGSTFYIDLPIARISKKKNSLTTIHGMIHDLELGLLTTAGGHTSSKSHDKEDEGIITDRLLQQISSTPVQTPPPSLAIIPSKPKPSRPRRILVIDDSQVNRKMLRNFLRTFCSVCDEGVDGQDGIEKFQASVVRLQQQQQQQEERSADGEEEHHNQLSSSITEDGAVLINVLSSTTINNNNNSNSNNNCCNAIRCTNYYDLIITDYLMPRMNGIEVVTKLRANGYAGKIIGLTGGAEQDMLDAFYKAGVDKMLMKPIQGNILQSTVQGN